MRICGFWAQACLGYSSWMQRASSLVLRLLCLCLAACAARPKVSAPRVETCVPTLGAADFANQDANLDGILDESLDLERLELGDAREIDLGDKLVYGLRFEQGGEFTDFVLEFLAFGSSGVASGGEFTLKLTQDDGSTREHRSNLLLTELKVHAAGEEGQSSLVALPSDFLTHGLDGVCKLADRLKEIRAKSDGRGDASIASATPEEEHEVFSGIVSLLSLLRIVEGDEQLNALLQRMITVGDMMSVAFAGGLTISGDFDMAIPCASLDGLDLDAWCFPFSISAGSQPLIHLHALITEPLPPLSLAGGLLALRATHAGDPSQRLTLVLIGARSGPRTDRASESK